MDRIDQLTREPSPRAASPFGPVRKWPKPAPAPKPIPGQRPASATTPPLPIRQPGATNPPKPNPTPPHAGLNDSCPECGMPHRPELPCPPKPAAALLTAGSAA